MNYRDIVIFQAVCDLVPKSEQLARDVLLDAYVNMGHAEKCTTPIHQYIDGRRGTGKTHLFGFLAESINTKINKDLHCAVYVDARDLAIESGESESPKIAARQMFRELILRIADGLRDIAARELWQNEVPTERSEWEKRVAENSHRAIETLLTAAVVGVDRPMALGTSKSTTSDHESKEAGVSIEASLSHDPSSAGATAKGLLGWLKKREQKTETQYLSARRVSYVAIREAIEQFLDANDLERLYVLLDEWAFFTSSVQPYLADLIKRTFLPSKKIAVKIATLPFQTNFAISEGPDTVGFERNGDIYQAIDLDADLVYQRNPERAARVLPAVLHKHLVHALRRIPRHMVTLPTSADHFLDELFTEEAHVRLLKFSHGNPRDYLNLFKKAYLYWRESEAPKINVDNITSAARDFGAEKLDSIKENVAGSALFQGILKEILQVKHQGVFMVREHLASSVPLQYLVHNRILHIYDRNYSSPTYSGERFVVLAIDYCVVVDHLNAPNYRHILKASDVVLKEAREAGVEPEQTLPDWVEKLLELQDPDRRKIRNTVLPDEYLRSPDERSCPHCRAHFPEDQPVFKKHHMCPQCGEVI
ncbi:hypothetical protein [Sorangium sp. So ce887]|uniref:hypothetical protein n=1 Tax=Sorangium sp. So ce887 TaxID=3133324 RepID=UPI003F5E258A